MTVETSRPKTANSNMSCCGGSMGASDMSSRGAVGTGTASAEGMLRFLRPLLGNRRVLIIGAIALAVIGIWANWGWMVALGIAPLILAFAPCAVMCALGFCMMGRGRGGQSSGANSVSPMIDPVSGNPLSAAGAISSVYQGHAYYFESRENRDTFESDPRKYLAKTPAVGQAARSERVSTVRP